MNNDSLAILLLTNRLVDIGVKPFSAGEFWNIYAKIPQIEKMLDYSVDVLVREFDITQNDAERAKSLCDAATTFIFELERLEESGISVLSFLDSRFPSRVSKTLGPKSSAFLLVAGDINAFNDPARGIVGSRNCDADAIEVAQLAATSAVMQGQVVVSGLAKGVDRIAMAAALDADGQIIGVPTEGIRRVAKGNEIRNLVHDRKICLVSPYAPDARFTVGLAMGRNRFVYALSHSTLVVASDLNKGGTWAGANEALKGKFAQVDVWTGKGSTKGNARLVELGGRAVSTREEFWQSEFTPSPTQSAPHREHARLF